MARDEDVIAETFRNYVESFQTLQPQNVVPYFDAPCLFISSQGVRMMADAKEVAAFIGQLMESLKSRGFSRSEITGMRVNQMSESIVVVSVRRIRYETDGRELERLGETYTFRSTGDGWKIATAMTHDTGSVLCKCKD
jgi:hypothetical protein